MEYNDFSHNDKICNAHKSLVFTLLRQHYYRCGPGLDEGRVGPGWQGPDQFSGLAG